MKKQKEVLRELREMFHTSAIFDIERTTAVLMVGMIVIKLLILYLIHCLVSLTASKHLVIIYRLSAQLILMRTKGAIPIQSLYTITMLYLYTITIYNHHENKQHRRSLDIVSSRWL